MTYYPLAQLFIIIDDALYECFRKSVWVLLYELRRGDSRRVVRESLPDGSDDQSPGRKS